MLAHGLLEEIDSPVQFKLADVFQMLFTGQRQQALGFLHVVHCLLCRFRIGLAGLDGVGLLQLLARLLQARVVHFGRHFFEPLQRMFRLLLNIFGLVGIVDLAFLAGVEVAPTLERATDGRHRDFQLNVARVEDFVLADQVCTSGDHVVIKVCPLDFEQADETVVTDRVRDLALPQLEFVRSSTTGLEGFACLEGLFPLLGQLIAFMHEVVQHQASTYLVTDFDTNRVRCWNSVDAGGSARDDDLVFA